MLAHAVVTVHPRVCGEQTLIARRGTMRPGSSPRVRGTGLISNPSPNLRRFIPACAGNRAEGRVPPSLMAVHPRVCGEQAYRVVNDMASIGSSPRVRGTDEPLVNAYAEIRFIPACAGNSNQRDVTRSIQAVHPRVCGEQWIWQGLSENTLGSSPRVRGTGRKQQRQDSERRFIPACAGNSVAAQTAQHLPAVHPRVCGEQSLLPPDDLMYLGSSPRVRGTDQLFRFRSVRRRFIPACAGNRYGLHQHTIQATVHPRVCGEQSQPFAPIGRPDGSSPRVRGTDRSRRDTVRLVRFIPACAGNRKHSTVTPRMSPVHPRVCGEQGAGLGNQAIAVGSSPRVRGTETSGLAVGDIDRFIPACAGNRLSTRYCFSVTTHPFTRPVHIPRICQRHFRQAQFEWQRVDCIQLLSQNRGNSISGTMPVHRILSGSTPRP